MADEPKRTTGPTSPENHPSPKEVLKGQPGKATPDRNAPPDTPQLSREELGQHGAGKVGEPKPAEPNTGETFGTPTSDEIARAEALYLENARAKGIPTPVPFRSATANVRDDWVRTVRRGQPARTSGAENPATPEELGRAETMYVEHWKGQGNANPAPFKQAPTHVRDDWIRAVRTGKKPS